MAGYHLKEIPKGVLGEASKIKEELLELEDALEQDAEIMVLIELSDLFGAIESFLERRYDSVFSMEDLKKMSDITKRAFQSGARK